MNKEIKKKLDYFKEQIKNENMSYSEIAELQGLAKYIDKNDVELLEWAGVDEKIPEQKIPDECQLDMNETELESIFG